MDTSKRERTPEEREQLRREIVEDGRGLLGYFWPFRPMQLGLDLVWAVLRLFQPLAPHLIPLAVFSATLPLILFLSFGSGYLVWKSVAVSWETDIYLQYGEGGSPYAEVMLPNIVAQQPYDISLHLVVPASEANFALGNFMATLTLLTPSNATIATAHRPAIVLPPLPAPWSYLSGRPGVVDLNIPMLKDIVVGTSRALARVELGRRDLWKTIGDGHGRELAVISGAIRGAVLHHGVRGLVTRFPLASAFAASSVFFFILFIGLVACLMPAVEWHFPSDAEETPDMEPEDKPRKRRRSRRPEREGELRPKTPTGKSKRGDNSSSRSRQRDLDMKTESEDWDFNAATTTMTSTPGTSTLRENPVRRRSSRHSDDFEP